MENTSPTKRDLFLSPEYAEHVRQLVTVTLMGTSVTDPEIYIVSGEGTSSTDGSSITLNIDDEDADYYDDLDTATAAMDGSAFHEVAHIRYNDFDSDKKAYYTLCGGTLPTAVDTKSDSDEAALKLITDLTDSSSSRYAMIQLYQILGNTIADAHDENKMMQRFRGYCSRCLEVMTNSMWMRLEGEEAQAEECEDGLTHLLNMSLIYARFGHIPVYDENHRDEYMTLLDSIADQIDLAKGTDDYEEKSKAIIRIMMGFLPEILKNIPPEEESEEEPEEEPEEINLPEHNQDTLEGNKPGGKNKSEENTQQPSQNESQADDNGGVEGKDEAGTSGESQPTSSQSSNSHGNETEGNADETTQQQSSQGEQKESESGPKLPKNLPPKIREKIAEAIQNALDNQHEDFKNPSQPTNRRTEKTATETVTGSPSDATIEGCSDKIVQEMQAREEEERNTLNSLSEEVKSIARATDNQCPLYYVAYHPTKADDAKYKELYKPLEGVCKRAQKKVLDALREVAEASTTKHRQYGKKIDAESTYRQDQKFYSTKKLPDGMPEMAVSLLVDMSGSMRGERINTAQKAAILLYEFCHGLGIKVSVAGHRFGENRCEYHHYTDYDSPDRQKTTIAEMEGHNCNRDGQALAVSAERLAKRTEGYKLLFILSDGLPTGYNSREEGIKHIQEVVKKAKRKGVEVIACAIDDKEQIKEIYGDSYLDIENLDLLPDKLVRILKKRILNR